ncbi:MAG: type II secretion system protein N [Pseudomonadota bacterium]
MKRLPFILSLLAVIALSASLTYWGLQFYKPAERPLAAPPAPAAHEAPIDAAAFLLGGQAAAQASNYQLTGVVAAGRDSVAILIANGKPAKAVKLGKEIEPGVTVKEVQPRYVMLVEGGVAKRIDLATDAKAGAAAIASPLPEGVPGSVPPPPPPVQMPAPPHPASTPPTQ